MVKQYGESLEEYGKNTKRKRTAAYHEGVAL